MLNDNIYEWVVALMVLNPDSQYYGGYFKAKMTFPQDYPYTPPGELHQSHLGTPLTSSDFKFLRPLYHPNVYPDGRLCISILHAPGADERALEMAGETAAERWTPVQTVESVLISVLSLLDDAEVSSPANVDAGIMLRKEPARYREMVKLDLEASKKDIPLGFSMPTHEDAFRTPKKDDEYMMSWEDSDEEDEFGGSDSEMEDIGTEDEDADGDDDDVSEGE